MRCTVARQLRALIALLSIVVAVSVCASLLSRPTRGNVAISPVQDGGSETLTFELGAEEAGLPDGGLLLGSLPDAHISIVWGGGQVSMFVAAEVRAYLFRGPSLDALRPHQRTANGTPVPVLAPTGADFDSEYAAFGAVLPGAGSGELLGFYHAEICDRDNFTATIGLARSTDGGVSWQRLGPIITGRNTTDSCDKNKPRGAGQPSVVRVGEYLYLYYTDWSGDIPDQIHLARAPLAQATRPEAWQKYYQGNFSEPGLGGDSTLVIRRPEPVAQGVYAANPSVSYNTYLQRYLAVFDANNGFWATTSTDGITWDAPVQLPLDFPQPNSQIQSGDIWYGYPSLVSASELSHLYTSQSGYLYYARGVYGGASHQLMRRPFTISRSNDQAGTQTPASAPITNIGFEPEQELQLPSGGVWICSGDVEVRRPDGSVAALYDSVADTGLVVGVVADKQAVMIAPYGAACEAADPLGPAVGDLLDERANGLLADGCLARCSRVHILEIEPDHGTIRESRWLP